MEVQFREALETANESTEDLEIAIEAIRTTSDLTQDWISQVNWLNRRLQLASVSDDQAFAAVLRFCRERLADVTALLGDDDEPVRMSVWWFSEKEDGLIFLLSNDIRDEETKSFVFKSGEGILGQAFAENRFWNIPDAPNSPGYVSIRTDPPEYRGLLCVPIYFGGHELLGMVSVDRQKAEVFNDIDLNLVQAAADILAYALTLPRTHNRFNVLPSHVSDALTSGRQLPALPQTFQDDSGE